MTRKELIAATLERWRQVCKATSLSPLAREMVTGDQMYALLRAELDAEPEPVPEEVRWCRMYDLNKNSKGWATSQDDALRAHLATKYQGREVEP